MAARNRTRASASNGDLRSLTLQNIRAARRNWVISDNQVANLRTLTTEMRLSIAAGDLSLLDGKWYVTHSGLMRLARRRRCVGIEVRPVHKLCQPTSNHWVFQAIAYKFGSSKGFSRRPRLAEQTIFPSRMRPASFMYSELKTWLRIKKISASEQKG